MTYRAGRAGHSDHESWVVFNIASFGDVLAAGLAESTLLGSWDESWLIDQHILQVVHGLWLLVTVQVQDCIANLCGFPLAMRIRGDPMNFYHLLTISKASCDPMQGTRPLETECSPSCSQSQTDGRRMPTQPWMEKLI